MSRWVGKRGGGYVLGQFLVGALVGIGPWIDRSPLVDPLRYLGMALMIAGTAFAIAGLFTLGGRNLTPLPYPVEQNRLVENGPYRLVRHPIYTGVLAVALGYALWFSAPISLLGTAMLLPLFDAKSKFEERHLLEKHPEYADYQKRTKKLIPWVY